MSQGSDAFESGEKTPPEESVDSLMFAVAAAPPRAPPSGPFASAFSEGAIVGRYRIVRELGRGGSGSVWEARHVVTEKRVALKIVRDGVAPTPQLRRRFAREAELVTAIHHPGVVPVHDVFDAGDGRPVLVMDFLSGVTFGQWLKRDRPASRDVTGVLAEVAAVVRAAHAAGVVHRDLKPENIFLCDDPSSVRVRVLDFGIARLLDPGGGAIHDALTDTGTVIGTPPYMAPEQLFGERNVDQRADVWALGVILYEVMAGRRPIAGNNVGQVVRNLSEHGVPKPSPADFPAEIGALLREMLVVDRNGRTRELERVEDVLRAHHRGDRKRSPERWTRPARIALQVAVSGLAAISISGVFFAARSKHEPRSAPPPPPSIHGAVVSSSELTFATPLGKTSPEGRALEAFRHALALRTHDRLTLGFRWPGATGFRGGSRALLTRLRTEQIDGAALDAKTLPSIHPTALAVQLPGVVDSWTKADSVRAELKDATRAGFESAGYRLLAWQDEGCQRILSRGRPVRRAQDLQRRRLAAIDADSYAPALYSLVPGAVVVTVGESDVAEALMGDPRLGVSAILATARDAERSQWTRSLEYMNMMPVACASGALVLRSNVYDRLDAESRLALDELSSRLESETAPLARREDLGASLRLGHSLTRVEPLPAERREWQRLFLGASRKYAQGLLSPALFDEVVALGREIDSLQ